MFQGSGQFLVHAVCVPAADPSPTGSDHHLHHPPAECILVPEVRPRVRSLSRPLPVPGCDRASSYVPDTTGTALSHVPQPRRLR
jgi:hypothetical protein